MLGMLMCLSAITNGCAAPTMAEQATSLANNVRAALENLNALSLVVEVREDSPKFGYRPAVQRAVRFKILMRDGARLRVEAFEEDKPFATIVCNGGEVTEWDAKKSMWTRYEVSSIAAENTSKRLLVEDHLLNFLSIAFDGSWVDAGGPFGKWLEKLITAPETRLIGTETIDGKHCDVVTMKIKDPDSQVSVAMTETYTLYFDRRTHLPVKKKKVFDMRVLLSSKRSTTDFLFQDLRANPTLSDDAFVFTPPAGSTFISADAPRFKKPSLDGKRAPNFKLPSVDGSTVSLEDYKDRKAILLVFWATWCGPCKEEMPTLRKLHDEFAKKGLAVIGVSTDKSMPIVKWFFKQQPRPYTILHDTKGDVRDLYFVQGIPQTFLIDRSGTVVRAWYGWSGEAEEADIRSELAKLLE
ncbi:MAG: redoxin domain-containing protein [Phycisphaerales bacterium]|nr:redoxin domain-containing protein [Phycisphaerales bacterium]